MKDSIIACLQQKMPQLKVRAGVSYRDFTSLGVGKGVLPALAEPSSPEELGQLLQLLSQHRQPLLVLGGGTNLVGADHPVNRVGIRLDRQGFAGFRCDGELVTVGAAMHLSELAAKAAAAGFGGLAALSGIPGTVGGAAAMNAGAHGTSFGDYVHELAGFYWNGVPWICRKEDFHPGYRRGNLPAGVIVTEVILQLPASTPEAETAAIKAEALLRSEHDPVGRSAGCTFCNVSDNDPAGKLIDECRLKGFRVGDLIVSPQHANFVCNLGQGSEADYLELIGEVRRAVAERFGFYLRPEVEFIDPASRHVLESGVTPPRVNVLYGGNSSEREVSLRSGAAVAKALENAGLEVELTDVRSCRVTSSMRRADVVYPVLHGGFGENGDLQRKLENAGIRFVGSGSRSSALCMDKIATKKELDRLGIPTARWTVITNDSHEIPEGFTFPLVLKVPCEGSTVGIIKVDSPDQWEDAVKKELQSAREILVEAFVRGTEITVPIVHGEVLPPIEIRSPGGFYDWDAKYVYKNGHTEYLCPVQSLAQEVLHQAESYALQFYLGARCRDILRVDFIVTPDGVPMMLEANNLPGCTATSLVPKAAKVAGISFEKMTSSLVYAVLQRPAPAPVALRCAGLGASLKMLKAYRFCYRIALALLAAWLLLMAFFCFVDEEEPDPLFGVILAAFALLVFGAEAFFHYVRKAEGK